MLLCDMSKCGMTCSRDPCQRHEAPGHGQLYGRNSHASSCSAFSVWINDTLQPVLECLHGNITLLATFSIARFRIFPVKKSIKKSSSKGKVVSYRVGRGMLGSLSAWAGSWSRPNDPLGIVGSAVGRSRNKRDIRISWLDRWTYCLRRLSRNYYLLDKQYFQMMIQKCLVNLFVSCGTLALEIS